MSYRVLVTDEIDAEGVAVLTAEPALQVDVVPTLPVPELLQRVPDYDALIGRSATRISPELLRAGKRLRVIGRAGVGVDNVAMDVATELGIAVINAPAGNTVAVAELFFGVMLGLLRHIPRAATSMREGRWDRSALLGTELRGKALGIVGVGRIGSEIAVRAHAFGMTLLGYDPYVDDERFTALRVRREDTLDALLAESDIVTIHTPLTEETTGLIGRRELARMTPGAYLANLARGGIVDDGALAQALESGHLRGAALDVYAVEPLPADHPIRSAPNVLLTPHLGASTVEGQRNVAVDACVGVRDALIRGDVSRSINVAAVSGAEWGELQGAMLIARRSAALARAVLAAQGLRAIRRVTLRCGPSLVGGSAALLSAAALGLLEGVVESERLNMINARALAEQRGIELAVLETSQLESAYGLEVALAGGMQELAVGGVATPGATPRVTRIGSFHVDVAPRKTLIVLTNNDVPGVIGRVGTLLGDAGVNIAEWHQARLAQGGEALAAISVDSIVPPEVCKALLEVPDVLSATVVNFR
ncbi:MAG TPA: phosphoglycerate dehydrogenase [Gemmatimonadaceae bacterium]|nr:phosphoglycerate dehydrogenase [Gemmatimonadaceae bacterium]